MSKVTTEQLFILIDKVLANKQVKEIELDKEDFEKFLKAKNFTGRLADYFRRHGYMQSKDKWIYLKGTNRDQQHSERSNIAASE